MDTDNLYNVFAGAFLGVFASAGLFFYLYDRFVLILQKSHPEAWRKIGAPEIIKKIEPAFGCAQSPLLYIFVLHWRLSKLIPLTLRLRWLLIFTELISILLFALLGTILILVLMLPL